MENLGFSGFVQRFGDKQRAFTRIRERTAKAAA